MSSVNQRKRFIANKLTFLTEQKTHLISVVDSYVDKVIAAGNSWADVTENRIEFTDLCLQIDKAVDYIYIKCEEISDATADVIEGHHIQPQVNLTTESCQPALSNSNTTSHKHTLETVQGADDCSFREVLDKIEAMNEAISSLQRNTGKIAEKQSEHDSQINGMLSITCKADTKQNIKWIEVKEQITNLSENQAEIKKEHNSKFQDLEEQLHKVSGNQKELRDETSCVTQQMERQIAEGTIEVGHMKNKINGLNLSIDNFRNECSGRIQSVEKLAGEVSEKVTSNTETLGNLSQKVTSNTGILGNLSQKVTSNTGILGNLSQKVTSNTGILGNLSQKVTSNTETLETLFKTQEQNKSYLREFEAKLLETEATSEAEVSKIKLQFVEIDTQLRDVMSVVTEVVPRMALIEAHPSRQKIGFTAYVLLAKQTDEDVPISPYDNVLANIGGHFDADTGLFTVPIDGLYVVSLYLVTYDNGVYKADIMRRPGGLDPSGNITVCSVWTKVMLSNVGNLSVCELKANDVLFLSELLREDIYCAVSMKFSCFRLG